MKQLKEPKATEEQTKKRTAGATTAENIDSRNAESAGELYSL